MLKQISEDEWNRDYDAIHLCETLYSVNEFTSKYNIEFEEYMEDGLGTCYCAFIEVNYHRYFLQGCGSRESNEIGVTISMQGNNPSVSESLHEISKCLGIGRGEFKWVQDHYSEPTWALLRQGDDGNEVELCRFYKKCQALRNMEILEKGGHKQCYTVKERT